MMNIRSIAGHIMNQVFCTDFGFAKIYGYALQELIWDIVILKHMHTGDAKANFRNLEEGYQQTWNRHV